MDEGNIIEAEKSFELKKLKEELKRLETENSKLKILLKEIDPEANVSSISDEEQICVEQIALLRKQSSNRELTVDEIKNLDVLHKNLKLARGENVRGNSGAKVAAASKEELEAALKK